MKKGETWREGKRSKRGILFMNVASIHPDYGWEHMVET